MKLAEPNVGYPLADPRMAGFMDNLDNLNATDLDVPGDEQMTPRFFSPKIFRGVRSKIGRGSAPTCLIPRSGSSSAGTACSFS